MSIVKASRKLGIIVFKRMATNPDVPDYDDFVVDEASMERTFYEFMANQP